MHLTERGNERMADNNVPILSPEAMAAQLRARNLTP
jgi:hypothetical protein